jgi:predicted O-methyltransferase YrrM
MGLTKRNWLKMLAAGTALLPASASALAQGGGRRRQTAAAQGAPMAKDDLERRALAVLDDVDRNQRYLNIGREDGRLLRLLAESTGAKSIVEVGTSTGYSGIWLALALARTGGTLTTFEIDRGRADAARRNFERAGVSERVTVVLGDAHQEVGKLKGPLDVVFIDADKEGYVDYLRKLLPLVRPGGLFVADNMRVPAPDPRYIKAITSDPALDTVFLNMHASGIGVSLKKI